MKKIKKKTVMRTGKSTSAFPPMPMAFPQDAPQGAPPAPMAPDTGA